MANAEYTVTPIAPGTWAIQDRIVRFFLLEGSEKAALIDSGVSGGDVLSCIGALTCKPVILINTHGDSDHISSNTQFDSCLMHPAEFAFYEQNAADGSALPEAVQDGELIRLGGRNLRVILLPGHTPGSIALLDVENRMLFTGDAVSSTPVFLFGRERSLRAYLASMENLASMAGEFDRIVPSHGILDIAPSQINAQIDCARLLLAKKLPTQEPPYPIPAKMYSCNGAAIYYDK